MLSLSLSLHIDLHAGARLLLWCENNFACSMKLRLGSWANRTRAATLKYQGKRKVLASQISFIVTNG